MTAADMEAYDPNYIGGDINGGLANLAPDGFPADGPLEPLPHGARGRLPVLGLHPARAAACTACAAWAPPRRPWPTWGSRPDGAVEWHPSCGGASPRAEDRPSPLAGAALKRTVDPNEPCRGRVP